MVVATEGGHGRAGKRGENAGIAAGERVPWGTAPPRWPFDSGTTGRVPALSGSQKRRQAWDEQLRVEE